jgi:hypothetical protein
MFPESTTRVHGKVVIVDFDHNTVLEKAPPSVLKLPKDWPALNFDHNAVMRNNITLNAEVPHAPVSKQSTRSTPEYLSSPVFRESPPTGGRMATGQVLANRCISVQSFRLCRVLNSGND